MSTRRGSWSGYAVSLHLGERVSCVHLHDSIWDRVRAGHVGPAPITCPPDRLRVAINRASTPPGSSLRSACFPQNVKERGCVGVAAVVTALLSSLYPMDPRALSPTFFGITEKRKPSEARVGV